VHWRVPSVVAECRGPKARHKPAWGNAQGRSPKSNPKRQRRGSISEIVERRMLVPHAANKPYTYASIAKPMERAFSALASAVRVPSPLGWAGMIGAFGAPRGAGAAPVQATKPEMSNLLRRRSAMPDRMFGRSPWAQAHGCHRCLASRDGEKTSKLHRADMAVRAPSRTQPGGTPRYSAG
jgi:hypothetical protein